MSRADERIAAHRLAEVLDGAEPADADLAATARVLRDAAAAARFDVAAADVEQALERARPVRPGRPPRRRLRVAAAGLAAAAVLAAVILLALPFTSGPVDVDVQARALAALGDRDTILSVAEVVRPGPGESFPASVRTGWIEPAGGRQRWTQSTTDGTVVAETMVDRGRVTRYDPVGHSAVVAASCTAIASGCADAVDPIAFYRRALAAAGPLRTHAHTVDGRRVYRVSLPVQRLGTSRIVQVATIDAKTLLPVRIAWRELRLGAPAHTFAVIVVREITREDAAQVSPGLLDLELPPGTRITQVTAPGVPVRLLSQPAAHAPAGPGPGTHAVVARAGLPRPPAHGHRAPSLYGRERRQGLVRADDGVDVRPGDPAVPARIAHAGQDDPAGRRGGPVLLDGRRRRGRRAYDLLGHRGGRRARERRDLHRAGEGRAAVAGSGCSASPTA